MRYILILLIISGCASIKPLEGGDEDVTPPKVLSVKPDSASLNASSQSIVFTFDEYIKTNNASQLLLISPAQKKNPDISIKGKQLTIKLEDTLKANTTYTIQFNGAIADNNEGNPLESYRYIFSTGDYIDSLKYSGYVTQLPSGEICEDCNVHLYESHNDSVVMFDKPDYLAKTDKTGNFYFTNLPNADFKVYVIKDDNKNLTLDDQELISLPNTRLTTLSNRDTFTVFPYSIKKENKPKLVIGSTPGVYQFTFEQPIDTAQLQVFFNNEAMQYTTSFQFDTITLLNSNRVDSVLLEIKQDSTSYDFELTPKYSQSVDYKIKTKGKTTYITSGNWIRIVDSSKLRIEQDSSLVNFKVVAFDSFNIVLNTAVDLTKPILYTVDSGFIIDPFGNTTRFDSVSYIPVGDENPSLNLTVNIPDSTRYIVQLKQGQTIISQRAITLSQTIKYNDVQPGSYRVSLIKDDNNNNNWDTGNPFLNNNAEHIINSEQFEMRVNWDKELTINDL